jgi:glycosyltransferase involved in cell wall biosynthesis
MMGLLLRPHLQLVVQQEDLPSARQANSGLAGWVDYITTKLLSKRANHIFAVSESVANAFSRMCNVPSSKINLIPPALDSLFIEKARIRPEPFIGNQFSILYAGSFNLDKGVTDLIQAFIRLPPGMFKLHLVGSAYIEFSSKYSHHKDIVFTGILQEEELFEMYTMSDIVVNPHRPILNSDHIFPFKIVETIASGALPLTTPVPGCEIFDLPKDCLFRDVDELTTKLSQSREIWQNNRERIHCCANSCRSKFSLEVIRSQLKTILPHD